MLVLLQATCVMAAVGSGVAECAVAAQTHGGAAQTEPVTQSASVHSGRIDGLVVDDDGRPVAGVALSAEGDELNFATSDALGRFVFRALAPGSYWVTGKLVGFANSARQEVVVRPTTTSRHTVRLRHSVVEKTTPEQPTRVIAAGLGGGFDLTQPDSAATDEDAQPLTPSSEPTALDEPTDHSSFAWRLRHQRRSVLREETAGITGLDDYSVDRPAFDPSILLGAFQTSARLAASIFTALPLSGQVRFLTTSAFDAPGELFGSDSSVSEGVAHVALESRSGDWTAQVAVMQGDVASWMATGNYRVEPLESHDMDIGVSYAAQRYNGANPAALAAVTDGGRNVGVVSARDEWSVTKRMRVTSTFRYGRYDYLDRSNLYSPAVSVAVSPLASTWVRASVSQVMTAPGAEEFTVSRAADFWGPPQRTFSPAQGWTALRAERTRRFELGLEREVGSFVVGVKRVEQRVDDQILTMFGRVGAASAAPDLRHYVVASIGEADVHAWTVVVARPVGSRVRGAVEYSVMDARLSPSQAGALLVSGAASPQERMHDITGSIEACVSETRTRMTAVYKVNTGFVQAAGNGLGRGADGRFDVQLHQGLPVPGARAAEWELLIAVRNLFFDRTSAASTYNELLVLSPPKRVVGGVSVKF